MVCCLWGSCNTVFFQFSECNFLGPLEAYPFEITVNTHTHAHHAHHTTPEALKNISLYSMFFQRDSIHIYVTHFIQSVPNSAYLFHVPQVSLAPTQNLCPLIPILSPHGSMWSQPGALFSASLITLCAADARPIPLHAAPGEAQACDHSVEFELMYFSTL